MTSIRTSAGAPSRTLAIIFAGIVLCWLIVAFIHLYFFAYASIDSWCYTAPAALAKAPFELVMPFLGTFDGSDKGWGLHWPGGPLLTSIITPFLPHGPATYVSIYICYWLLLGLAVAELARRLTASPWIGICAFLLVACDKICFSVAWFERFESLDGTIAIAIILALCGPRDRHAGWRAAIVGLGFYLLPLLHPVFLGLGLVWLAYLGFSTIALRRPWKPFLIAAAGTVAGFASFYAYYHSRPWLYAIFANHAHQNLLLTSDVSPPGVRKFVHDLFHQEPTGATAAVYLAAIGGAFYLAFGCWKSRREWREYIAREEMGILTALATLCNLALSQLTYNAVYWATAWPFAVAVACLVTRWLMDAFPERRRLVVGAALLVVLLHGAYLPARTYLWYKTGFVNMRAQIRDFAGNLPHGVRLFLPVVFWDTYAGGDPNVLMNSLPYTAGDEKQKQYAAYILPQIRPGDVLVLDSLQSHPSFIDPHQPGWKEIAHGGTLYQGDHPHGYGLTAYQKE